jgi:cytochrome P450 family 4
LSPLLMGRNPKTWKTPCEFIPERFELDNLTNLNPFAFMPFSAGPRNCIGQKFAMLEMKSTVSKVLRHFEIEIEPGFELALKPEIVLKPLNGVKLRLKSRIY